MHMPCSSSSSSSLSGAPGGCREGGGGGRRGGCREGRGSRNRCVGRGGLLREGEFVMGCKFVVQTAADSSFFLPLLEE